jgi:hypothetical protein
MLWVQPDPTPAPRVRTDDPDEIAKVRAIISWTEPGLHDDIIIRQHQCMEGSYMLSKQQLMNGITELNPTADLGWLDTFDEPALRLYLDHLQVTIEPRGTSWLRTHETTAIVCRRPAA